MPPAPRSWHAVTALLVVAASTHADIVDPELGLFAAAERSFEPGKLRVSSTVLGGADDVDSGWQLDLYNEQRSLFYKTNLMLGLQSSFRTSDEKK